MVLIPNRRNSKRYKRVMGIDSSTQGIAWSIVQNGKPIQMGKIYLDKISGLDNKVKEILEHLPGILEGQKPDIIYIEQTIYMRNVDTMRILSYVVGVLIAVISEANMEWREVKPLAHKEFTGYLKINNKFRQAARKQLGSVIANKLYQTLRKSQTQNILKYNFPEIGFFTPSPMNDNDVSDACSVALYGYNESSKIIKLKYNKKIALKGTPQELLKWM